MGYSAGRRLRPLGALFALIAGQAALSGAALAASEVAPPAATVGIDWPMYNKDYAGQRYSRLTDLAPATVDGLKEACRVKIAAGGSFQSGPVMVDGLIFVTAEARTAAVDARDCSLRWTYDYQAETPPVFPVNRGVAVLDGRVFRGTPDGRLLALDAQTGKKLWKDVIAEPEAGEYLAGAPIAWNGIVIIGIAGGDFGARGRILAYEAETGREIWRFDTVPTGKEFGAETWTAQAAKTGGGATWSSFAIDPKSAELFVPVGNPSPDFTPDARPGTNLFTDSLVVLDARTGTLKWWYQISPHDGVDLDLAAAPMLYRDKQQREVVALTGKDGYLRVLDRETHRPLFQQTTTTVDEHLAQPTKIGVHTCPGSMGGTEWNGAALDPVRRTVFVPAVDWCQVVTTVAQPFVAGKIFFGGTFKLDPAGGTGWVNAIDADSGTVKWRYHAATPVVAAITPTASGIVLAGDLGGELFLFDAESGKILRKIDTGGALAGGIVTYQLDGREYVAFNAGNVSRTAYGALGDPSLVIMRMDAPVALTGEAAEVASGKAIFAKRCTACHAGDGSGVPGHNLADVKTKFSFDETIGKIKNPTAPMPQFFPSTLNEQDVKDVASFVRKGL